MLEGLMSEEKKRETERLIKKYKPLVEDLSKSPLGRVVKINEGHVHALVTRLKQTESIQKWAMSEYGSQADLGGKLPASALDIVSINFNTDPLQVIAGSQEMRNSTDLIAYKKVLAKTTRGNVTSGQILRNPLLPPEVYAENWSDEAVQDTGATTVAGTLVYSFTLSKPPVRRGTVTITVSTTTDYATDIGDSGNPATGTLRGIGISATCVYANGNVVVTFATDPGNGKSIIVDYATNFEEDGSYPMINSIWDFRTLTARVFALGTEYGVVESFQLSKIAGIDADTDMINTISQEMTAEMTQKLIKKMWTQAVGTPVAWSRTAPSGVSDYLHIKSLHMKITQASSNITANAGRGQGNILVGDNNFCSYLEQTNDDSFKRVGVPSSGVHIRGIYKGDIPVVCAPNLSDGGSTYYGYMTYKGTDNYDIAAVLATFMPFFTAGNVPKLNNLLKKQALAGSVNALENLVPAFTTRINITA